MRTALLTALTFVSFLAVVLGPLRANAQSGGLNLWPFGEQEQSPPATTPESDGSDEGWLMSSPLANIGWPEIKMPKFEFFPSMAGSGQQPRRSPMELLASGSQKVVDGTRNVWNRTVDRLKFRGNSDRSTAVARSQQPFWKRLFGQPEEPEGPRTVTEWLAQARLDP